MRRTLVQHNTNQQIKKLTMAFTQQEATEIGASLDLLNAWEDWMQELWTQAIALYPRRGYALKNENNEIYVANHYTIKINMVNDAYLEADVLYKQTDLATVRCVGKKDDLCGIIHVLLIQHLKNAQ